MYPIPNSDYGDVNICRKFRVLLMEVLYDDYNYTEQSFTYAYILTVRLIVNFNFSNAKIYR